MVHFNVLSHKSLPSCYLFSLVWEFLFFSRNVHVLKFTFFFSFYPIFFLFTPFSHCFSLFCFVFLGNVFSHPCILQFDIFKEKVETHYRSFLTYRIRFVEQKTGISYVIWSSWISRLSEILIFRYSPSKEATSFVSYCFSHPTFTHISGSKCPILMEFSAKCSLRGVV